MPAITNAAISNVVITGRLMNAAEKCIGFLSLLAAPCDALVSALRGGGSSLRAVGALNITLSRILGGLLLARFPNDGHRGSGCETQLTVDHHALAVLYAGAERRDE